MGTVARSERPSLEMADNVELKEAFKLFDMDGDGMITKDELRKLVEKVGGSMTEGEANGFITKDEMLTVITDCDHFAGDKMEEARKCIAELDVDKDGRVSYPEFLLVWKYKSK